MAATAMSNQYRVPVLEVEAVLYTNDGKEHLVRLFMPPGQRMHDLLDASEPFFGVKEQEKFRLYSRGAIACVETEVNPADDPLTDEASGLAMREKHLCVRLRAGGTIRGALRFVPHQSVSRLVDVLNLAPRVFALFENQRVRYVVKSQVESVEEI